MHRRQILDTGNMDPKHTVISISLKKLVPSLVALSNTARNRDLCRAISAVVKLATTL